MRPRPEAPVDLRSAPAGLATHLRRDGSLHPADLARLMAEADSLHCPVEDVLRAAGTMAPDRLARAQAAACGMPWVDAAALHGDLRLISRLGGARACLRQGLLPLQRIGGVTVVAIARPETWPRHAAFLQDRIGAVQPCHADPEAIRTALATLCAPWLRQAAETCVEDRLSARRLGRSKTPGLVAAMIAAGAALALLFAPGVVMAALAAWLVLCLLATTALRILALANALRPDVQPGLPAPEPLRLPVISVLVPLYNEPDIAPRLVQRLQRLDYPRALLDAVIVLEEKDRDTQAALSACRLPGWMRIVTVPDGPITTKPRAMNLALDHCRGSIIGIYDAEDAPDPDQLHKVAARFAERGSDLACLQGALDYYNPRTNLIARLFTAEYAAWFRVMLPAVQRLGWPVPLGGTTLFIRRAVLEQVGRWDAHNVTEDADLGVRLARHGYRTEMLASTTHEEANCRLRPWVRQRSRWIKGHLLTWAVHMRDPRALWRDLGWRGFIGYQVVFLGAQTQVLLAPVMWSFWALPLGLPHPVATVLPQAALWGLAGLFLLSEMLVMAVAAVGLSRTRHRGLRRWVPLLHLYHPLGAIAGWRAVWEAFRNPFYWAKTSHGHFDATVTVPADNRPSTPTPVGEPSSDRIARSLAAPLTLAELPRPAGGQRTRTSPASIFRRVSNAREIWVRSAS